MSGKCNINIQRMLELNLCLKSVAVFCKMNEQQKWAHKKNVNNEDYFALSRKQLIAFIPELGSVQNVSRLFKKLKDRELICIIQRKTRPYCRVTKKGLELLDEKPKMFRSKKEAEASEGEFTFKLSVKTEYEDLNNEYLHYFKRACLQYLKDNTLPESEYEDFLNHNQAVGNTYVDWRHAFKSWCSVAKTMKKNYDSSIKKEGYFSKL